MSDNRITLENAILEGRAPQSYWDVDSSDAVEGFATDISVNAGSTIDFKIDVDAGETTASAYQIEIFRLGYYGGDGARMVASMVNTQAVHQDLPLYDASRGLVDAGNWQVTDQWDVPEDMVSGVFLARVQMLDANGQPIAGETNQIPFIVRNDGVAADIVLQTSDTTWQAYNGWCGGLTDVLGNGDEDGPNFYGDDADLADAGRAYAVSYNRPIDTRDSVGFAAGPQDSLYGADYAAISWLEQNGYDVSYISGVDADRLGPDYLTNYGAYISVGHDEYWSGDQRANVAAARDAGVNLLFWSGNECYWKTRYEGAISPDGTDYRTLVCYKETWAVTDPNAGPQDYVDLDPTNIWTGTWMDQRFIDNPLASGGDINPSPGISSGQLAYCHCGQNALTGQLFVGDGTGEFGAALDVPQELAGLRLWRDTGVGTNGGATGLAPGLIGYEWDTAAEDANRPAGLVRLSETSVDWSGMLVDQGNTVAPGTGTHALSLYRAESGALVFGAGTVFWSWALSDAHDSSPYGAEIANTDLQQLQMNIFAEMGIQPGVADAVLASRGLVRPVPSADTTPASAAFAAATVETMQYSQVTLTGTATDDDGNPVTEDGRVALVELSFDDGLTWRPAAGFETWSYTFTPQAQGTFEVLVRAVDDTLNMPSTAGLSSLTLEVGAPEIPSELSLFDHAGAASGTLFDDQTSLTLGMRFTTTEAGAVTDLHYYRAAADAGDTDTRTGQLWNASGTLLGEVTFVSTPGMSGWQTATLANPVAVAPGATYVVTYTTDDNYLATANFFGTDVPDPFGILEAPAGGNGVFALGSGFPTLTYRDTNYWADVTFMRAAVGPNTVPAFTGPDALTVDENRLLVGTVTASDPDFDPLTFAVAGGADAALFAIDPTTGVLTFLGAPDYEAPADADADNVYELTLSVTDARSPPVTRAVTVTVGDVAEATGQTLFGPADLPAQTVTNDPGDYELGVRFEAAVNGTITGLRYYRGEADAGDTDTRTLHLWSANGTLLATATLTSTPGEAGWQVATLDTAVTITAGTTYVASYGTTQNYAYTSGFFGSDWIAPDGTLHAAPAAGVYAAGGPGLFPTSSYQNANYWVDALFAPTGGPNQAPVFTSPQALSVAEDTRAAGTLTASDADGNPLVFAIAGGADAAAFTLDSLTGALAFLVPPDFEAPGDANGDNVYSLTVSVGDGFAAPVTQALTITVLDGPEPSGTSIFSAADLPDQTVTNDPSAYELGTRFTPETDGTVTELRYFRGLADAADTDTRALTLWSADGTVLATVTSIALPQEAGWQGVALPVPVALQAGETYIVSYGTNRNYAVTSGGFAAPFENADGTLTVGIDGGVFATSPGQLPTASYGASNYFVDVLFEPELTVGRGETSGGFGTVFSEALFL